MDERKRQKNPRHYSVEEVASAADAVEVEAARVFSRPVPIPQPPSFWLRAVISSC